MILLGFKKNFLVFSLVGYYSFYELGLGVIGLVSWCRVGIGILVFYVISVDFFLGL